MKIEAVIFDLDGVLIATDRLHYEAWKKIADRLQIPFDETMNRAFRGVGRMDCLAILIRAGGREELSLEERRALAEQKNEWYKKEVKKLTSRDIRQETRDTLYKLKAGGYKIAVASSSKNAKTILEKTGLTDLFDAIVDGNQIKNSKPHPEVFLKAAGQLGVLPEKCLVVEDAESGILAAEAAGMEKVLLSACLEERQKNNGIQNVEELLDYLER